MKHLEPDVNNPASITAGPGSILYDTLGDRRINFTGLGTGILLLMHPEIGSAVEEHSNVFDDVWDRTNRSIPLILGSVYDDDPVATARHVAALHIERGIRGIDKQHRSYNAMKPETWWWAHATFVTMVMDARQRFYKNPLDTTQQEQLYAETNAWYQYYGLTMRPVPKDYEAFKIKRSEAYEHKLELTKVAAYAIGLAQDRQFDKPPEIPEHLWKRHKEPIKEILRLTALGELPSEVRERFNIEWSKQDAKKLNMFAWTIKNLVWPRLGVRQRYFGVARYAHRRDGIPLK